MTKEQIKREYMAGELASIDAIEELQKIGYSSLEAENIVDEWDAERA